MNGDIYVNFPVSLLNGIYANQSAVMGNVIDFCVYAHSLTLQHGSNVDKFKASAKFFCVNYSGAIDQCMQNTQQVYQQHTKNKTPYASIPINTVWEFKENPKTEFEVVCFAAYCAIKSIIGNKGYAKTNKQLILSRMYLSPKLLAKYKTRYNFDKLKQQLISKWYLKAFSLYCRGFYLSFTQSVQQLAILAQQTKQNTKKQQAIQLQKQAYQNALNVCNSPKVNHMAMPF